MGSRKVVRVRPAAVPGVVWPPPRPPGPDVTETPWGCVYTRGPDGLYRLAGDDPTGRARTLDALDDVIDRFHRRWSTIRIGLHYRQAGPRLALLWRNRDGTYRGGHCAIGDPDGGGPLDGRWLVERGPAAQARARAELWVWEQPRRHPAGCPRLTGAQVAARLGVR